MTFDEYIKCEKEKAEHAKEEYLMLQDDNWTDIETYEKRLESCANLVKYHEQIAEWLEGLKSIRQWKTAVIEDFCKYDANSIDEVYRKGIKRGRMEANGWKFVEIVGKRGGKE